MKAYWGVKVYLHALTSALYGDVWSASRPGRHTSREITPGTHWIGGWVGPKTGLDAMNGKVPSPFRKSRRQVYNIFKEIYKINTATDINVVIIIISFKVGHTWPVSIQNFNF
jgi:hypothetical protein